MPLNTDITRADLKASIEAGIARASFESDIAARLRDVGESATRVLRGGFYDNFHECGCPLVQAGVSDTDGTTLIEEAEHGIMAFYGRFDDTTPSGTRILNVVG